VTRDQVKRAKPDPDLFLDLAGAYRVYEDPQDMLRHLDEVGVRLAD
jgi:beta-phosphoglucomutase-like phosphatase (HAD superfamily)